jgi:hypothetical protein
MARTPVVVVERNGEFFVEPPMVIMSKPKAGPPPVPGDSIMIINTTSEDLVLRIEAPGVFGAAAVLRVLAKRGGGAGSRFVGDVQNGAADGEYPYQVLMIQSGKKAKGNSDPMIIIDD